MKTINPILIVGILILSYSCKSYDYDSCTSPCYSPCDHRKNCYCVHDSANFHCPSEIIHGIYNYDNCTCRCQAGWIGTLCDQRDTKYYVQFRFGTDTSNLSGLIRTSSFSISFSLDTFEFFEFADSLPSEYEIDTIIATQLRLDSSSKPFCVADTACAHLEMLFRNGESAIAFSGYYTLDPLIQSPFVSIGGTFNANLYTSTGDSLFMRDGKYFLPLAK